MERKNDILIKKDLYEIYKYLYYVCNDSHTKEVFSSKLTNKFKYLPSEIATILEIPDTREKTIKKSKEDLGNGLPDISGINSLREFYYQNLSQLFNADIDEQTNNKILNSISINDLKYLYSLISSIPIKSGKNKKDIIYMFKYYFDDEARTDAMTKNLK